MDKNNILFHIPHSSITVPDFSSYSDIKIVKNEIGLVTDFFTDLIFNVQGIDSIIFPFSRVFCDVERFPDKKEPLFKVGRGFYYTHTDDGYLFRDSSQKFEVEKLFKNHHKNLTKMVSDKVKKYGEVLLLDCHSFPEKPFRIDMDFGKGEIRPDIVIGSNANTPQDLVNKALDFFVKKGFSVKLNYPYSGAMCPKKFSSSTKVHPLMIEVNRRLYLEEGNVQNKEMVSKLNTLISEFCDFC